MFLGYIDPGTGYTLGSGMAGVCGFLIFLGGLFLASLKKIFLFFKKRPHLFIILLIILGALIYFWARAMMQQEAKPYQNKIIILGFDGLSPRITEKLMREGKLPNFSKLRQNGSYRHLATTNPPQSPVAWASFATGKNPGKHGIFDFIVRNPKNYSISLSLSHVQSGAPQSVLKAKGFWWYSSQKKVPAIVLGCPMTFPPEKILGRMLSGMGVPDIRGTEGTFTFYTTQKTDMSAHMGNIIEVNKGNPVVSFLLGPKFLSMFGKEKKAKVPFKVSLNDDGQSAVLEYQNKKLELKKGQWSPWQDIRFEAGPFKNVDGIFKVFLIEVKPDLKLYVSPINFDPRNPLFPISYPPQYSKEIAEKNGLFYTQGMPFESWGVNEGVLSEEAFLEQVDLAFTERKELLDLELKRFTDGILYCYFGMPDIIQHMFWRYIDPEHPMHSGEGDQYANTIEQWYERMDQVLGDVMNSVHEEDTIIVISDHGFDTFRRSVHINTWLRENNFLVLKDPDALQGKPLFEDVDWSKTRAYAVGFGGIYINQKGREQKGIVDPKESRKLKTEIIDKMSLWTDDENHQPIVHKVYRSEEIFSGKYASDAPDLFVGFNIGYEASWQTALGEVPSENIEDNMKKWSGSHLFDPHLVPGILFSNKKVTKENPSLYDLTPSILKLIGYTDKQIKDDDFDGEPLFN